MVYCRLAFLGFGNVGKALAQLLLTKRDELRQRHQIEFSVTGIATGRRGKAIDPNGIDLERAVQENELTTLSRVGAIGDEFDFIRRSQADVVFESIPVNYATGQPALDALRFAFQNGKHVITANKGPVIHGYQELSRLARDNGCKFFFEATVMDGAPIFSLFREALPGANLKSFYGILNSTTNLILTLMEHGESFEKAVAYCQEIGIAETDPSGDIDGWDAAIKVALLASVLMGTPIKPDQVERNGIRQITREHVNSAVRDHKRWKLVCKAWREGDRVKARVSPELVSPDSPLYGANGTTSLINFETDVLGLLSLVEADPGPRTTAYGMFADFMHAVK